MVLAGEPPAWSTAASISARNRSEVSGALLHFSHAEGFPHDWIRWLCEDQEGTLWTGAGNAGLAFDEVLNVRGADIGDDTPLRRGDAGKRGDFSEMVHAHFNHGDFVFGLQAQQLQGQAEGVVEIALRLEDIELCAEGCGYGFLGGGFSG